MKNKNHMKRFISLLALSIAGIAFTGCLSEQEKNSREAIKSLLAEAHFKRACAEGDSREAVKWWRKAAEQGDVNAQEALKQFDK